MVFAQIAQTRPVGQMITHQLLRHGGKQHLAAMPCRHQVSGSVDRAAVVVAVPQLRAARVQSHPHPQRHEAAFRLGPKRTLSVQGGAEGLRSSRKSGMDAIAGGLDDAALILLGSGAKEHVVASQGRAHGVGMRLPQPGASLDVGKKKRHGSGRQAAHGDFLKRLSQKAFVIIPQTDRHFLPPCAAPNGQACCRPQSIIASTTGRKLIPSGVSEYSTFGGT